MFKSILSDDSILDNSAYLTLSAMPIVAVGVLGVTPLLYAGLVLGVISAIVFVARFVMVSLKKEKRIIPSVEKGAKMILGFAYPAIVTTGIINYRVDNPMIVEFYLFDVILVIGGFIVMFIPEKKEK